MGVLKALGIEDSRKRHQKAAAERFGYAFIERGGKRIAASLF